MKTKTIIVSAVLLFASVSPVCAGNGDIRTWAGNIEKFNKILPQEKVYIHFDNSAYYQGEQMWFKCYVMRSDNNQPTDVSRVLYVELLDASGNLIDTKKLQVDKGQADGVFNLKNVLAGGFYEVRAYTRYMLNWDSSWIFSRIFPIYNAPAQEGDYGKAEFEKVVWQKRAADTAADKNVKNDSRLIDFYPEGGHLVEGLPCRVAFELKNKNGMPVDGAGELMENGRALVSTKTLHEGRGSVLFTPQPGKTYTLRMKDEDNQTVEQPLPQAEPEGCALSVKRNGGHWLATLSATPSIATDSLGVMLTAHGTLRHLDMVKAEAGKSLMVALPDEAVAEGVNRVSVVDGNGQIIADRLFFSFPHSQTDSIAVKVDGDALAPSSDIGFKFHTAPSTTFSLSIRDAATEKGTAEDDCQTWMLLTGELHGYVHQPAYYLESDDEEHHAAADLLMMVQGWRRYDLGQMMGKKRFTINYPIEKCLSIIGRLKPTGKKYSVANMPLRFRLYNQQGQTLSGNTTSDAKGYYTMMVPACAGEWTMFVNTDKHYKVGIDRNFSPAARLLSPLETVRPLDYTPATTTFSYADALEPVADDSHKSMTERTHTLKNVLVKKHFWETGIAWDNEREGRKGAFTYYNVDKEADQMADQTETTPLFVEWLLKRNSAFRATLYDPLIYTSYADMDPAGSVVHLYRRSDKDPDNVCDFSYDNKPVLWVLNNRPYCVTNLSNSQATSMTFLTSASMESMPVTLEEVKSVYVTDSPKGWQRYVGRFEATDMATVYVYTHKMFTKCPKGLRRTFFNGYDTGVQFYNVQRGDLPADEDHRRTLYWNPNVTTNDKGEAQLTVFNTPRCRQLIISAEAITPQGKALKNK